MTCIELFIHAEFGKINSLATKWFFLDITYDSILEKKVGQTIVSIFLAEHTNSFEEDLCQLVKQLVRFNFLDIHGHSCTSKIEFYRAMVKRQFPHSIFFVDQFRFRLSI